MNAPQNGPLVVAAFLAEAVRMPPGAEPPSIDHILNGLGIPASVPVGVKATATAFVMVAAGEWAGSAEVKISYRPPDGLKSLVATETITFDKPGKVTFMRGAISIKTLTGLHWIEVSINDRVAMRSPFQATVEES